MKNNSKKLISLLLAFAMVLSIMPAITLAASAAEIEKPVGVSIVQDYDVLKGVDEGSWAESVKANLPAEVSVDGVATPVTWADPAEYVDPSVLGYYSIPGAVVVGEETLTTSITVEVRQRVNLLAEYDPSFEDSTANYGFKSPWTNNYANKTGFITPVTSPVKDGTYSRQFNYSAEETNPQLTYIKDDYYDEIAALVNASGSGEYCFSVWGRLNEEAVDEHELRPGATFTLEDGTELDASYVIQNAMQKDSWVNSVAVYTVPADSVVSTVFPQVLASFPNGGNGDLIYLDDLELCNISVLPIENEPAINITEVSALAPIAIVKDYDTYVADWKAGLNLPATVTVTVSDGTTDTVEVVWDYAPLEDLSVTGKYVLTGKLSTLKYTNDNNVTVQQVVLIREKTNLVHNGDFKIGTATNKAEGWELGYTLLRVENPDDEADYIARFKASSTATNKSVLFSTNGLGTPKLSEGIANSGAGQYYMQFIAKSVSYGTEGEDSYVPARADTQLWPRIYYNTSATATSGFKAQKTGTAVTLTEEWQTIGCQFDIDTLNPQYRLYVQATIGTAAAYFYLDNIEVFPLRINLPLPADCEHADRLTQVVEPTCTEAGYTINYCPLCGDSYNSDEVEALGHTEAEAVVENNVAATCGKDGSYDTVVYCSVCDAEISRVTTPVPATGEHTYDNDSDPDCNICDAIREVEPAQAIKYASADLDNSLDMNFYINDAVLSTVASAKIVQTKADGTTVEQVKSVEDIKIDKENDSYISYNGMAAKEMGDTITVTLYDAEENVIGVWVDSMKDYLIRIAEKNPQLQTLCTDLLHYGAAAQEEFDYNVTNLVNSDLDTPIRDVTAPGSATNPVEWTGSTLTLESSIIMEVFFAKAALTGNEIATVTYDPVSGDPVTKEIPVTLDAYYDEWSVKIEGLALADVNTVITVTIGEITVTDSMASYAGRQLAKGDIYKAILAVGESAKAYFETMQ